MQTLNNAELAFLSILGNDELTRKALKLYNDQVFLFTEMFCPHLNLMWNGYVELLKQYWDDFKFRLRRDIIAAGLSELVAASPLPDELKDRCDSILGKLASGDVPGSAEGTALIGRLVKLDGNRKLMAKLNANADLQALQQSLDASKRVLGDLSDNAPAPGRGQMVYNPLRDIGKLATRQVRVPTGINWLDDLSCGGGRAGEMWLVMGCSGGGKCLRPGTLVMLYSGETKAAADVRVGDLLMGPDSKPRTVVATTAGNGDMYRIVPVKGAPFECNGPHVMTLRAGASFRYAGTLYRKGDLLDISVEDYMSSTNIRMKQFAKLARSEAVDFPYRAEPELDPYFVGLYLGDGTRGSAGLTTADNEVVDYCVEFAAAKGWRCTVVREDGERAVYVRFCNDSERHRHRGLSAIETLRRNVLLDGEKRILPCYKYGSRATRLKLLAGILDADGCMGHNAYDLVLKGRGLAEDVEFIARSLGLSAYMHEVEKTCTNTGATGTYYRMCISGDVSTLPVRIPRRKGHTRAQVKNNLNTGFSVVPIGVGDYAGFELDGDGRFLLGDFTITHNSTVSVQYACAQALMGNDTLWVTYEQSLEGDLAERMIANITDTSLTKLRDVGFDNLPEDVRDKFLTAVSGVDDRLVALDMTKWQKDPTDPEDNCGVASVRRQFTLLKEQGRHPKTVILDWFGSMMAHIAANEGLDLASCYRFKAQEEIDKLVAFAREEGVLVIVFHQLDSKANEARPTSIPGANQAQDMKSLQNYFDLVLTIGKRDENEVCYFASPKNRKGQRIVRTLRLIGDKARFVMEDGWLPDARTGSFYRPVDGGDASEQSATASGYSREVE